MQKRSCIHIENQAKKTPFFKIEHIFDSLREKVVPVILTVTALKDNSVYILNYDVLIFVVKLDVYF